MRLDANTDQQSYCRKAAFVPTSCRIRIRLLAGKTADSHMVQDINYRSRGCMGLDRGPNLRQVYCMLYWRHMASQCSKGLPSESNNANFQTWTTHYRL